MVAGTRVILVGMWLGITAAPSLHRSSDRSAANRTVVLCATTRIYILRLSLTASIYHSYSFFAHRWSLPNASRARRRPARIESAGKMDACSSARSRPRFRIRVVGRVSPGRISGMQIEQQWKNVTARGARDAPRFLWVVRHRASFPRASAFCK